MKYLILIFIFCSCSIRHTNTEIKKLNIGDTVYSRVTYQIKPVVIIANDTVHRVICYKWPAGLHFDVFDLDACDDYDDFIIEY